MSYHNECSKECLQDKIEKRLKNMTFNNFALFAKQDVGIWDLKGWNENGGQRNELSQRIVNGYLLEDFPEGLDMSKALFMRVDNFARHFDAEIDLIFGTSEDCSTEIGVTDLPAFIDDFDRWKSQQRRLNND